MELGPFRWVGAGGELRDGTDGVWQQSGAGPGGALEPQVVRVWVMLPEGACAPASSEMCFTTCHTHGSGIFTKNQFIVTQN